MAKPAARKGDPTSHSGGGGGGGGASAAAAGAALSGRGGMAAAAAAVGGGGGGGGPIIDGSPDVLIGNQPAARAGVDAARCPNHTVKKVAQGAATIFVNNAPLARQTDQLECSGAITSGHGTTLADDATVTVLDIHQDASSPSAAVAAATVGTAGNGAARAGAAGAAQAGAAQGGEHRDRPREYGAKYGLGAHATGCVVFVCGHLGWVNGQGFYYGLGGAARPQLGASVMVDIIEPYPGNNPGDVLSGGSAAVSYKGMEYLHNSSGNVYSYGPSIWGTKHIYETPGADVTKPLGSMTELPTPGFGFNSTVGPARDANDLGGFPGGIDWDNPR